MKITGTGKVLDADFHDVSWVGVLLCNYLESVSNSAGANAKVYQRGQRGDNSLGGYR